MLLASSLTVVPARTTKGWSDGLDSFGSLVYTLMIPKISNNLPPIVVNPWPVKHDVRAVGRKSGTFSMNLEESSRPKSRSILFATKRVGLYSVTFSNTASSTSSIDALP